MASELAINADAVARRFRGPGSLARGDQLIRATLSISSNIAEACGRGTVREFRQFLSYARGSSKEALSQLRIARGIDQRLSKELIRLEQKMITVMKMIDRLSLNPPPTR